MEEDVMDQPDSAADSDETETDLHADFFWGS